MRVIQIVLYIVVFLDRKINANTNGLSRTITKKTCNISISQQYIIEEIMFDTTAMIIWPISLSSKIGLLLAWNTQNYSQKTNRGNRAASCTKERNIWVNFMLQCLKKAQLDPVHCAGQGIYWILWVVNFRANLLLIM